MIAVSRNDGTDTPEPLAQSLGDLFTTPVGSRLMRRDYGSDLPNLTDAPMNELLKLRIMAATADAIKKWHPELNLTAVKIDADENGKMNLKINFTKNQTAQLLEFPL
jgi:uncharacterized protein